MLNDMKVFKIKSADALNFVNGMGCSIWFSGCNNYCKECWASNTWNPNIGKDIKEALKEVKEILDNKPVDGISLLGGDPLYHLMNDTEDKDTLIWFLSELQPHLNGRKVCMWSGYKIEEIKEKNDKILDYIDVLVDGKFDISKRDLTLKFRGSSNQRIWKKDKNGKFEQIENKL